MCETHFEQHASLRGTLVVLPKLVVDVCGQGNRLSRMEFHLKRCGKAKSKKRWGLEVPRLVILRFLPSGVMKKNVWQEPLASDNVQ